MSYERDTIRRMSGYVPGEQPDDPAVVKLNTNENPYPPADAVLEALRDVPAEALRRYPSPSSAGFRAAAAAAHGLAPDRIVATNGGDELLRLAVTTFVDPAGPVGVAEPSYSLYPVLAAINASPVVRVPLDADWRPADDFAARLNAAGVRLAFLVNPHAPSGVLLDAATVSRLAAALDGVLLVDEAYVDFVDPGRRHDLVPLVEEHDNLLLLRTMSKGYSLAGLRLGYGIGAPTLLAPIAGKTRDSYAVDAVAERLGAAALVHRAEAARSWAAVRDERRRLAEALRAHGIVCPPSESNFLLARLPAWAPPARDLQQRLKAAGVLVRYFDQERLRDCLRITIGTPEQNGALLTALADALATTASS